MKSRPDPSRYEPATDAPRWELYWYAYGMNLPKWVIAETRSPTENEHVDGWQIVLRDQEVVVEEEIWLNGTTPKLSKDWQKCDVDVEKSTRQRAKENTSETKQTTSETEENNTPERKENPRIHVLSLVGEAGGKDETGEVAVVCFAAKSAVSLMLLRSYVNNVVIVRYL
jgi:hypothetical protein